MNWKAFFASTWFVAGIFIILLASVELVLIRRYDQKLVETHGSYFHHTLKILCEERFARAQGQVKAWLEAQKQTHGTTRLEVLRKEDYETTKGQAGELKETFSTDLVALGTFDPSQPGSAKIVAQSPEPPKGKGEKEFWGTEPALKFILTTGKPYSGVHCQGEAAYQITAFAIEHENIIVVIGQSFAPPLLTSLKEITGGSVFLAKGGRVAASAGELPSREQLERDLNSYFKPDELSAQTTGDPVTLIPYSLDGKRSYVQLGPVPTPNREGQIAYGLIIPAAEATAGLEGLAFQIGVIGWITGGVLVLVGLFISRNDKIITQTVVLTQDGKTVMKTQTP